MTRPRASAPISFPESATQRVLIDRVTSEIDGGRYPIKRTMGESVVVSALDPSVCLAHVFRLRRRLRTEKDF